MEKNNFDKFISDKLAQRQIEFNPAHWEAAQSLIDQQQEQKRRKRFGWWMLLIPLLTLLAYYCYIGNSTNNENVLSKNSALSTSININESTNTPGTTTASTNTTNFNQGLQPTSTLETTTTLKTPAEANVPESAAATNGQPTTNAANNSDLFYNNTSNPKTTPTTTNASSGNETPTDNRSAIPNPARYENATVNPDSSEPTSKNIKQEVSLPQAAILTPEAVNPNAGKSASVSAPDEVVVISDVVALDAPTMPILLDDVPESEKGTPKYTQSRKRFDMGFTGGALFYTNQVEGEDDERIDNASITNATKVGLTAGLTFGYRLSDRFSLHADAIYQWRKESFRLAEQSVDEYFSFGQVSKFTETEVGAFHSVEMPLYVQFNMGRNSLEAGAAWRYLMGVKGVANSTAAAQRSSGEADLLSSNSAKVWVADEKFNRLSYSYLLGYRFWMNDRLGIGVRATYTPSAKPFNSDDYADNLLPASAEGYNTYTTQSSNLSFNLNVKWYFNKRNPYRKL